MSLYNNTVMSPFCNLSALESVGGAYMWDLTFYLANTPLLLGPHLDVDIGQTDRTWFDIDLSSLLLSSTKSIAKID